MKKPKKPKPTAQEVAATQRQQVALDKEIEEQEGRFKALARGKLGSASLLGGAPRTRGQAASGARGGARGAGGSAGRSMLGGAAAASKAAAAFRAGRGNAGFSAGIGSA